jgi:hypothetical protein
LPVLFRSRWRFDGASARWVGTLGRRGTHEVSVRVGAWDRLWGRALVRRVGVVPSAVEYQSVFGSRWRRGSRRRAFEAADELAATYALPDGARAFLLASIASDTMAGDGCNFRMFKSESSYGNIGHHLADAIEAA